MSFIRTIPVAEATGDIAQLYRRQQRAFGFVPNYAKVFCHRPALMGAWAQLLATVREPVDSLLYELVTLAAARALGSSYCALAHGTKLLNSTYSPAQLAAMVSDGPDNPLSAGERAVMRLAEQVVVDASAVSQRQVDQLRDYGYSDADIFDIVAVAAARCFFAKIPDALGAKADAPLGRLDSGLLDLLVLGRAVATQPVERIEDVDPAAEAER